MSTAIEVKNITIKYKLLNQLSVKQFFRNSKKSYFVAIKNLSFSIDEGEIIGIIGRNGSGKSTLLRAIAGILEPDEGTIQTNGKKVSLLSLGVGFQPKLTGRENIVLSGMLLGFTKQQISEKTDEIIAFAELGEFIDRPMNTYSSGMQSKLAFSITSILEPDIMLIDEVLSVGDAYFQKKSFEKMKSLISDSSRTVLIVSHSDPTIRELCDKVLWLDGGKMKMFGETREVLDAYKNSIS